jgi:hypothetical protein
MSSSSIGWLADLVLGGGRRSHWRQSTCTSFERSDMKRLGSSGKQWHNVVITMAVLTAIFASAVLMLPEPSESLRITSPISPTSRITSLLMAMPALTPVSAQVSAAQAPAQPGVTTLGVVQPGKACMFHNLVDQQEWDDVEYLTEYVVKTHLPSDAKNFCYCR